ncbi:hypothetical protein JVT61DRAFT_11083 [Boletus reticuloceps]|uniref:Uncharacterized protein n=1 Tax=Boletus reticuloceps TaxID=495285 RepID=A0A8I3A545_9AGAM|nr:hypothetical protein JVT61DRAFT_11083 [Boletus reticuloceps]
MSLVGVTVLFCKWDHFDQYQKEKEVRRSQQATPPKRKALTNLVPASNKQCLVEVGPRHGDSGTSSVVTVNFNMDESEQSSDSQDEDVEVM